MTASAPLSLEEPRKLGHAFKDDEQPTKRYLAEWVLELADEVEQLRICSDALLRSLRAGKPPTEYALERLERVTYGEMRS